MRGQCDSFVVETDVHYPTDFNLLWDCVQVAVREVGRLSEARGITVWRQHQHLLSNFRKLFNRVSTARRWNSRHDQVKKYLDYGRELRRVSESVDRLDGRCDTLRAREFIAKAATLTDQIERRVLKAETIAQTELADGRLVRHRTQIDTRKPPHRS